ncbi:MAG TPA: sugar ABC transporter permease [Gaiellaceae bacterium]|nr:sugar ABC transporter permease [Gaiellaceae bacterium]
MGWLLARVRSDRTVAVLLVLPSIVAVGIFVYGFIGWTGYVSLSRWRGLIPDYHFVGADNYQRLADSPRFQADIRNTIVFTALFLLSASVIGFIAAALLDQRIKGEAFFRGVFLFPMAISFIVTGIAWQWLFNPSSGVNLLSRKLGYDGPVPAWSTDADILLGFDLGRIEAGIPVALLPVVVAATWQLAGFTMAMYLAGIRGVPEELREAARVDGANEWQVYRRVVMPLLRPITLGVVVILGHISLKIFDLTVAMTGSGPNFTADMPAFYMFETTFRGNYFALGAAIAMVLLFLVATLVIPYLYFSLRREATR